MLRDLMSTVVTKIVAEKGGPELQNLRAEQDGERLRHCDNLYGLQ